MKRNISLESIHSKQTNRKLLTSRAQKTRDQFIRRIGKIKNQNLKKQFISKLQRNNIYSKPIQYNMPQNDTRILTWKGWQMNKTFEAIIILLDIGLTLLNFVISTFQAFLDDFAEYKKENHQVTIANVAAGVVCFIIAITSLVTIDVEDGVYYIYITDIIKKQLKKGRLFLQIALFVVILLIVAPKSSIGPFGYIFFILCLIKLFFLSFSLFKVEIIFINTPKRDRYWNFLKVFVLNFLFAHFVASIMLALLKLQGPKSWYRDTKANINVVNPGWRQMYVWAFYWACTTMTTVGFGDFVPVLTEEAIVVSLLQILSAIVMAYNISQIGNIMLSIKESSTIINNKIGLLRRMNKENKVSNQLNLEIEQFIVNQTAIQEEFQYAKHRQLISILPTQLQKKYYSESQANIFRKMPFFRDLSTNTLVNFFMQSTGKVYYPGEFLVHKNLDPEIIITLKGAIGFCYKKIGSIMNQTVIQSVYVDYSKDRPIFLSKYLLNRNQGIYYDIKAIKYSYSIIISLQCFMEKLQQSQTDYHYYLKTLDTHQQASSLAVKSCEHCKHCYHTLFQWPKLHYMPLKSIVIHRHRNAKNENQKRGRILKKVSVKLRHHAYLLIQRVNYIKYNVNNNRNLMQSIKKFGSKKHLGSFRAISSMEFHDLEQIEEFEHENIDDYDIAENFNHYFPSGNSSKLYKTCLRNKKKSSKKLESINIL